MQEQTQKRLLQFAWVVPLLVYAVTMARTIGYVDAGLVLRNSYFLKISAYVNNHNLFSLLGWVWMKILPFGNEFLEINILSMLCGAFTVYFVFRACVDYTGSLPASAIAATALMLSHSLWWHSTMLEVYTLNTLLIALILFSFTRYYATSNKLWLYASLLFWGLGVSNHVLMGLLALAFIVLIIAERKNLKLADYGIGIACLLAGLAVLIVAFAISYQRYGSWSTVLHIATGGDFRSLMFSGESRLFWGLNYVGLIVYQYPSLVLIYIGAGIGYLFIHHRKMDLIIVAAILPLAVWSASYFVWDMWAFSLPVYVLLAFPLAKGLVALAHRRVLRIITIITLAIPIVLYPTIVRTKAMSRYTGRYDMEAMVKDAFSPGWYFLNPIKTTFSRVDDYVDELFETLPEGSWYFDNSYDYPIRYYYQDIRAIRRDVRCPIIFAFWVTEQEIANVVRRTNAELSRNNPVYMSPFVFATVQNRGLNVSRITTVRIQEREIYRLY
jgi:hypothetical protein